MHLHFTKAMVTKDAEGKQVSVNTRPYTQHQYPSQVFPHWHCWGLEILRKMQGSRVHQRVVILSSSLSTTNTRLGEQPPAATSQQAHKPCGQQQTEAALEGHTAPASVCRDTPTRVQVEVRPRPACQDAASGSEEGRDWNGFCQVWAFLKSAGLWALLKTIKYR